jgi:hypothetical protein
VYAGRRITTFVDRKVRNGDRYTYLVMALDRAGNESVGKEVVTPAAILLSPRQTAHVRGGTTLRWRPVPRASYYNVQLWLHGHKVLTVWPSGPSLPLRRLAPGSYTWFVWPGFGDASKHRYGNLLGRSTFVVTR